MKPVRRLALLLAAFLAITTALPVQAQAQQVVVQRHVTVREEPSRRSDVVKFPAIGEALDLLDDGARQRGYYHVRLSDGRIGWVYYTFVRRTEAAGPAGVPGDVATAHFIDVDQGSAALLEFPCGAILIDAGGRDTAAGDHLIQYLEAFFFRRSDLGRRIAAVFVTHTHVDHNRALRRVAETFSIGGYVHNGLLHGSGRINANWMVGFTSSQAPAIPAVAVDDSLIGPDGLGGTVVDPLACERVDPDIRVLSGSYRDNPGWPDGEFDNGNNHSLVIRVTYGSSRFLFTGDLEEPAIETLLTRYQASGSLDTDVYVVGHHGSANGTTPAFLTAMTPQAAVISMGPSSVHAQWTAWAYGHPRRSIVTMLDQAIDRQRSAPANVQVADRVRRFSDYPLSDAIYGTGWNGDIRIQARPDGAISIETAH